MRTRLQVARGLALILALGGGSASARAGLSERQRVAAHKRAAFERLQEGDYAGGVDEMRAAHALRPHPGFILNIALAYHRWGGHCREALEAFEAFRVECPDCKLRDAGEARRTEVVAACEVPVTVRTEPPGAALRLDGDRVGLAPRELRLVPGAYRLVAELEGHGSAEQGFVVEDGAGPSLVLELVPLAMAARPAPVLGGEVGADRGASTGPGPWPWVALGVGAAGLGAGALFTVETLSIVDREAEARARGAGRAEVEGLRADADTSAILAHVGYGVGAIGLGLAIVLWALGDDAPERLSVAAAGPSGASARIRF